jgi:hypothetical protein
MLDYETSWLGLLSVDDNYNLLATQVHACADVTGNGKVSIEDFEIFCWDGMPPELSLSTHWEEAFPDPLPDLSPELVQEAMNTSTGDNQNIFHPLSKCCEIESNSSNASPFPNEITVQIVAGDC